MDGTPARSSAQVARDSVFVGRKPELAALRAALERAIAGADQLVMLAGEAGMGKTRLCQELAEEAAGRGALLLGGAARKNLAPRPSGPG